MNRGIITVLIGLVCSGIPQMAKSQSTDTSEMESQPTTSTQAQPPVPDYLVNHTMPAELIDLVKQGKLTDADKWITRRIDGMSAQQSRELRDEQERLNRLRRDFDVPAERLLDKIKRQVPNATLEDIEQWRQSGAVQWLLVDGEVRYFRREPSNLFLFDESAKQRRASTSIGGDPAGAKENELIRHCAEALAAARDSGTTFVLPMTFHVRHKITVKPGVVPKGETIRCWMPYPQEYQQQQAPRLISASPEGPQIAPNGSPMRTLYFEQIASDEETVFSAEYEYTNSAYVPDLSKPFSGVAALTPEEQKTNLSERLPHVELTPEIRELAAKLVGEQTDPIKKAYAIWDWVEKEIPWAAEIEYAVLPNIVQKVLECKRGDCGTQALLFITLARAADIPARWQSGWVMRPRNWNLHDWAEFHTDTHGWLPADPSIGRRKSDDEAVRDFLFGHIDTYRMIANLDYAKPFVPAKEHLRSDPIDNQRGEVEWKGGNLYYDDWSYKVDISVK